MYIHVFACICNLMQVCALEPALPGPAHVLADYSCIAAQKNGQGQNVLSGMLLAECISYLDVVLSMTLVYLQIHTYTYIYIHIHTNIVIPTWQSEPKSAVRPPDMSDMIGLATAGNSQPASQSLLTLAGPLGHGDGEEHPMQHRLSARQRC